MAEATASDDGKASPFTEADFQRVLDEEKSDSEEGWHRMKKSAEVEVWRKKVPDVDIHLVKEAIQNAEMCDMYGHTGLLFHGDSCYGFPSLSRDEAMQRVQRQWKTAGLNDEMCISIFKRGFLHLPGVSVDDATEMITNLNVRSRWDKQFTTMETLEEHDNYKIVYWVIKLPPLCADRDVVQYTTVRREPDQVIVLYKNASYEKPPIRPNIIRGETILSGTVIRPDEQDSSSSRVSLLLQNDLKGWIPTVIVNAVVAHGPGNWRNELLKFYRDVYSKEKEGKE